MGDPYCTLGSYPYDTHSPIAYGVLKLALSSLSIAIFIASVPGWVRKSVLNKLFFAVMERKYASES